MTFFHMELFLITGSEIIRYYDNHFPLSSSPASIAEPSAQCHLNLEAVKLVLVQPWEAQYPRASLSTQLVLVDISREENKDVKHSVTVIAYLALLYVLHMHKQKFKKIHIDMHMKHIYLIHHSKTTFFSLFSNGREV